MATTLPVVMQISTKADGQAEKILSLINKDARDLETSSSRATRQLISLQKALSGIAGNIGGINGAAAALNKSAAAAQKTGAVVVSEEQKKIRAREEARRNLEFALREEEKYRLAVQAAAKKQEQVSRAADQAAVQAAQRAEQMTSNLKALGSTVALGLSVAGAALGALALQVVNTAREFEAYETTLKTVQGTSLEAAETFRKAKEFAARTPFDVKGIVAATVQLEVYGQRSEDILPKVAALAAGMGKRIDETGLVVGKALSGSLEGFESLRNTYGISTRELVRYGAEVNKAGGLLIQTAAQADKAKNALLKIIDIKFGTALADRAATVDAAVSNAGDSITNFVASVGQAVGPLVKLGAVLTGKLFDGLNAIPGPLKAIAGVALLGSAALFTMTGTAGLATVGLFALDVELKKVATSNAAVAATSRITSGALGLLGRAAGTTGRALTYLTATPAGLVFTGLAAAATAAYAAVKQYESAQIQMQKRIKEETQLLQEEVRVYRDLISKINEKAAAEAKARGKEFVPLTVSGDRQKTEVQLNKLLDNLPAEKLRKTLDELGVTYEELQNQEKTFAERVKNTEKEIARLQARERDINKRRTEGTASSAEVFGLKGIQDQINALVEARAIQQSRLEVVSEITSEYDKQRLAIEGVAKASQQAQDFLKYSDDGSLRGLGISLQVIQEKLGQAGSKLRELNQPLDRDSLVAKLREGVDNKDVETAIKDYIDLLDERTKYEEKTSKKKLELGKDELAAIQQDLEREKAIRKVSRDEELNSLKRALRAAQALGKEGAQEEIRLLQEIKQRKEDFRKEDLEALKKDLGEQVKASQQFIQRLNAQGAPSSEIEAAYSRVIKRVEDWRDSHGGVITANRDLRQEIQQTLASLRTGQEQAAAKRLTENFQNLQQQLREVGVDAQTSGDKLEAVERKVALVKQAQARGSVETAKADKVLADLARERAGLEQSITQEKLKQAGERNQLEIEGLQQEIDYLELKREQGIDVTNELIAKRQELHELRLRALDLERQAELETTSDKAATNEKFALKNRNLERERTLDLARESQKRLGIAQSEADSIAGISPRGGNGSSGGQAQGPQGSGNGFAFGNFNLGFSGFSFRTDEQRAARKQTGQPTVSRAALFEQLNPEAVKYLRNAEVEKARILAEQSQNYKPFGSERVAGLGEGVGYSTLNPQQLAGLGPRGGESKTEFNITNNLNVSDGDPDVQNLARATENLARKERRVKDLQGRSSTNSPIGYGG